MLRQLQNVDGDLAGQVANNLGLQLGPKPVLPPRPPPQIVVSPSLSQAKTRMDSIVTRVVAILAADGVDGQAVRAWLDFWITSFIFPIDWLIDFIVLYSSIDQLFDWLIDWLIDWLDYWRICKLLRNANLFQVAALKSAIQNAGGSVKVIAPRMGTLRVSAGSPVDVDGLIVANPSILFDAVFIPGGLDSVRRLQENGDAVHYALEAYVHFKAIAAAGEGGDFLSHIGLISKNLQGALPDGIFKSASMTDDFASDFIEGIKKHRFFGRERTPKIPA